MGIVESRILAKTLLTACDQAEKVGNRRLDETQFWQDTTIRGTPRQPAIRKAIARSSKQLQVSRVVQDLQDKHESLFSLHSPGRVENNSDPSVNLQLASLSCYVQASLQTSSLADFYNFIIYCEQQQQLGKIRLRIFRVRLWVGRGERYDLIARDLGGLGVLYILPEYGGESVWTKELPKSATKPNRIAMIKHLREQRLPEEAERRGLHTLAEDEVAKVLGPTKAALDQVIENHLSQANSQVSSDDERPCGTGDDWLQSKLPRSCQART
ncbi:hypothetical protein AnigIFM63604_003288, partial [Aspergillus niger]